MRLNEISGSWNKFLHLTGRSSRFSYMTLSWPAASSDWPVHSQDWSTQWLIRPGWQRRRGTLATLECSRLPLVPDRDDWRQLTETGIPCWEREMAALNVHRNRTAASFRDGERGWGEGVWRLGERYYIPIATPSPPEWLLHLTEMGSDESHFNVSRVGSDGQSHDRAVSTNGPKLLKRKESRSGIEPRSFRLPT